MRTRDDMMRLWYRLCNARADMPRDEFYLVTERWFDWCHRVFGSM